MSHLSTEIVVTVKNGRGTRRYVVDPGDHDVFEHIKDGTFEPEPWAWRTAFGAQWLRPKGVDEMHRSLSLDEVVRVKRVPGAKINRSCGCGAASCR